VTLIIQGPTNPFLGIFRESLLCVIPRGRTLNVVFHGPVEKSDLFVEAAAGFAKKEMDPEHHFLVNGQLLILTERDQFAHILARHHGLSHLPALSD
jgi:hypothetical protein